MNDISENTAETTSALSLLSAAAGVPETTSEHDSAIETGPVESASEDNSESQDLTEVPPVAETKALAKTKSAKSGHVIPPDPISKAAKEIENLTSDQARDMAKSLVNEGEFETFRLGGVFSVVNNQKYFLQYGFPDFKSWVEAEHGYKYRKAMYLAQVYDLVLELKLDWAKIHHIGWTKLKTILNPNNLLVNAENIDEWIEKAEKMTVLQLEDLVKAKSESGNAIEGDEGKTTTTLTFKLHTDQKETIRTALEQVKAQSGTAFDTVALEMMALEYLGKAPATPVPASPAQTSDSLEAMLKGMGVMPTLELINKIWPDVELNANMPEEMLAGTAQSSHDDL
jgi:hypothetical protein